MLIPRCIVHFLLLLCFLLFRASTESQSDLIDFVDEPDQFAEYLRRDLWHFGACANDIVMVLAIAAKTQV